MIIVNNVLDKLSPILSLFLWTSYLILCGQVISLIMSILPQKICVLIVSVCRNGSNERWS
jgi:hypothetical protein